MRLNGNLDFSQGDLDFLEGISELLDFFPKYSENLRVPSNFGRFLMKISTKICCFFEFLFKMEVCEFLSSYRNFRGISNEF